MDEDFTGQVSDKTIPKTTRGEHDALVASVHLLETGGESSLSRTTAARVRLSIFIYRIFHLYAKANHRLDAAKLSLYGVRCLEKVKDAVSF